MEQIDLNWMPAAVRRAFDEGVRLFAEAVRDGTVMHMQDGYEAMQRASQIYIREGEPPSAASLDPSI
jgi:hypothetical protein